VRVLFLNPPSIPYTYVVAGLANRRVPLDQVVAMPMGILYLAAMIRRDLPEADVRVVDLAKALADHERRPDRAETTLDGFADAVLARRTPDGWRPDLVGISILFSTAHRSTLSIAEAVKRRWPGVPVIAGGMHATNAVGGLLESPSVDYVCRGEAESIVCELARRAARGEELEAVAGVIGRRKGAACPESAPLVYDLDTIPFPAWELIPMAEYVASEHSRARSIEEIAQDRVATLVTTRGCPFHCTFCASWTVHGREMRYRSIANVLAELEVLHERHGVSVVVPEDDLFTVKKPRILALCEAVTRRFQRRLHFQFPNGLSVATLDADVIAAMVHMGMDCANIAIESGSDLVQRRVIKKNLKLERARGVVAAAREQGIVVRCYYILGFPGETRAQMAETVAFAASLPADWSVFSIAAPLIGTEMYQQLLDRGAIDQSFNWDSAFFQERSFDTPEVGAGELKDLAYRANLEVNFFGNFNLRTGNYKRAYDLFHEVARVYDGHVAAHLCMARALDGLARHGEAEAERRRCRELIAEGRELAAQQLRVLPEAFAEVGGLAGLPAPAESAAEGPLAGTPREARQAV